MVCINHHNETAAIVEVAKEIVSAIKGEWKGRDGSCY